MKRNKKFPLISVVVPSYNAEKTLGKNINSLLNQSYKNVEIIVVDDGSLDKTLKVAFGFRKKSKRVKIISISHSGSARARNIGIKKSKGKYIVFISSDIWVKPSFIKSLISLLVNNPGISGVDCYFGIDKAYSYTFIEFLLALERVGAVYAMNKGNEDDSKAAIFFKKKSIGQTKFDEKLSFGEEFNFCKKLKDKNCKFIISKNTRVYHHEDKNIVSFVKHCWKYGKWKSETYRNISDIKLLTSDIFYFVTFFSLVFSIFFKSLLFFLFLFFSINLSWMFRKLYFANNLEKLRIHPLKLLFYSILLVLLRMCGSMFSLISFIVTLVCSK